MKESRGTQQIIYPLSLFAVLICWALPAYALRIGEPAPPIALASLPAGHDTRLSHLRGKVVYIDFWASWCGPCRLSFPLLEQLRAELGPRGFEVLAVNVDEFEADALEFLAEVPVNYPVVRDAEGDTPQAYGVLGMPTGYLIDRRGVVRYVHQGFRKTDGVQLRAAIIELLED
jgi:thiol-disulfide isomerase/thioredoxin